MGKKRKHHNANSGFSLYTDDSVSSIAPYTGGQLDKVNPDFRVPADLPVPEPPQVRRSVGGVEEPFSYLFYEIDYVNNPTTAPDLTGWQIYGEEGVVIKVPFLDDNTELSPTQPVDPAFPSTLFSNNESSVYFEPDFAEDPSLDAPVKAGIIESDRTTGTDFTVGTPEIVVNTGGTILYVNSDPANLVSFNSILSERGIGIVPDIYNNFDASGSIRFDYILIYARVVSLSGTDVQYETFTTAYDPATTTVLSSGNGGTTQVLDTNDVESSSLAPQTFIDLTANFVSSMPSSIETVLNNQFTAAVTLSCIPTAPPGYTNFGPDPAFTRSYVWDTNGFTSGTNIPALGSTTSPCTGIVPQSLTYTPLGGPPDETLYLFMLAQRFVTGNLSSRARTAQIQIEKLWEADSIIEMTGTKKLYFQKLNEAPVFINEYKIDAPVVTRLIPRENDTVIRVYENNSTASVLTNRSASAITGVDSLSDTYTGDYGKVTEYVVTNGSVSSTTYTSPTAPAENVWVTHTYDFANLPINIPSPFFPNQVEALFNSSIDRIPATLTVEEYYEETFTVRGITGGDLFGHIPRQPTLLPGATIGELNWGPTGSLVDAYGNNFGIGGLGDFGNVIDGVCYYISVSSSELLADGQFGLADDALEGFFSSISQSATAPLYPNANVSWISKATKEAQSDRAITLFRVEGTWDGVSFTETDSGTQRVALPRLLMASVNTSSLEPPNYLLVAVVYDPFN